MPTRIRTLTVTCFALAMLVVGPGMAFAQEKPFDPVFEVLPSNRIANEPVQLQINFELKEGDAFVRELSFRIPGAYQLTNSDDMPDKDVVGDGLARVKFGAVGQVAGNICISNKSPNIPGNVVSLEAAIQIGTQQPGSCSGLFSLSIGFQRFPDGDYGIDATIPDVGLDTPFLLTLNIYGVSKSNTDTNPPTPGGTVVVRNPKDEGSYTWYLKVTGSQGQVKEFRQNVRVDRPARPPERTGAVINWPLVIGGVIAGLVLLGLILFALLRRRREPPPEFFEEAGEYYAEDYAEYDYVQEPAHNQGVASTRSPASPGSYQPPPRAEGSYSTPDTTPDGAYTPPER